MRKLKHLAQQVYTRRFKTRRHSKRQPVVVGGLIALRDGFGLAAITVVAGAVPATDPSRWRVRPPELAAFFISDERLRYRRLAHSGHAVHVDECPLSGAKRIYGGLVAMSAYDPKRTSAPVKNSNSLCCNGNSPPAGRMVDSACVRDGHEVRVGLNYRF